MTVYLTAQQVLFIHARLIDATGGEHGLLDLGRLQAAVARPQATFEGVELYGDLFHKAAALMESLLQNHPFLDGNKRTAIAATALFLLQNGRRLQVTNEALEQAVLWAVNERPALDALAAWLEAHVVDSSDTNT